MKYHRFLESNFANNSNDKTTFVASKVLSTGSKVGLCSVHLAAFEYFRPGIMRFDRPIRIKYFTSPGYEVAISLFIINNPETVNCCNFLFVSTSEGNFGLVSVQRVCNLENKSRKLRWDGF